MQILTKRASLSKLARSSAVALAVVGAFGAVAAPQALAAPANKSEPQTPKLPVIIDGVRQEPEAIHRFDGQDTHLMLRRGTNGDPELVVSRQPPTLVASNGPQTRSPGGNVVFRDRPDGTGDNFWRWPGDSESNLRRVCTAWWCPSTFDDVISSVDTHGAHTVLYEHANFAGSSLEIWNEFTTLDLRMVGFDNVASSLWVG